ncbi:Uncharacterised protein [Chlamydia trachomatis]|nr:Uncharacterised protein [Chlamydia trachomatis]
MLASTTLACSLPATTVAESNRADESVMVDSNLVTFFFCNMVVTSYIPYFRLAIRLYPKNPLLNTGSKANPTPIFVY